jgi:3-oxoacid CoA-transferase subunit A
MKKVFANADEALYDIPDGATVMLGGFGLCGIPENSIAALVRRGVRGLHTISNNMGVEQQVIAGKLKVDLIPQGTLAERIRAGGAGIPAFYTPAGVGTVVADGKETREFEGKMYLLEMALRADFALVKAWRGDTQGNLVYRRTARNFNPMMATAARITIAEVEELVEPGELDPDLIHTPGIYVKRIYCAPCEKRIERRTVRKRVAVEE